MTRILAEEEAVWWREITQDDQTSSSDAGSCRDSSLLVLGYRHSQSFTVANEVINDPNPIDLDPKVLGG